MSEHPAKRQRLMEVANHVGYSSYDAWGLWRCPGIGCGTMIRAMYGQEPELCVPCHNMIFHQVKDAYRQGLQEALPAAEWGDTLRVLLTQKMITHYDSLN